MTDLESTAAALEATGEYRVLRRLPATLPQPFVSSDTTTLNGLIVDVETTGLDHASDEIIEFAAIPFSFRRDGAIVDMGMPYRELQQPSVPISQEITRITGLDDAAVAGHFISPDYIEALVAPAVLIVAHNAAFDRPFCEALHPIFAKRHWACSMDEIPWRDEGIESRQLGWILAHHGLFYERHRATEDCRALLHALARPLPRSGSLAMGVLLASARRQTYRLWAEKSPFAKKDILKARGYRWNPGDNALPKSWYIDVSDIEAEREWLRTAIYAPGLGHDLWTQSFTALERYSKGWRL